MKNNFELTSASFKNNEEMPKDFINKRFGSGCLNKSPDLRWNNIPEKTESFVIICNDPDAVGGDFIHWVIYNIHKSINELFAGIPTNDVITQKNFKIDILENPFISQVVSEKKDFVVALQGKNDFGLIGYDGPCPPAGTGLHHYTFTIYALDKILDLPSEITADELKKNMKGHILAQVQLIGLVKAHK